jgi:uncharacterized protein (DUF1778 family)
MFSFVGEIDLKMRKIEETRYLRTGNLRTFANMAERTEKARFDARLTQQQKQLFEQAAAAAGFKTLSDFVLQAAQEKAIAVLSQQQHLVLTAEAQKRFFDLIENPPEPNEYLKAAWKEYQSKKF